MLVQRSTPQLHLRRRFPNPGNIGIFHASFPVIRNHPSVVTEPNRGKPRPIASTLRNDLLFTHKLLQITPLEEVRCHTCSLSRLDIRKFVSDHVAFRNVHVP